ncbi:MAG: CYTH domain-containing protein, partial [Desulfocapsaceae bacterium]
LKNDCWKALGSGVAYRQGYISVSKEHTVRVRIAGEKGFLTIKGGQVGAGRLEFEYAVPPAEAEIMLEQLCIKPLIEKNRYQITYRGSLWEVDEFFGDNQGLVVAEIELRSEDQPFDKPDWIGLEVTGDPRYYNASLISYPYSAWR